MSYHVRICEAPYDEWLTICVFILFSQVLTPKFYDDSSMSYGHANFLRVAFSWRAVFVFFPFLWQHSFHNFLNSPHRWALTLLRPLLGAFLQLAFQLPFPLSRISYHDTDPSQVTLSSPFTSSTQVCSFFSILDLSLFSLETGKEVTLGLFYKNSSQRPQDSIPWTYLHRTLNKKLRYFQQRKQGCWVSFAMSFLLCCLLKTSGRFIYVCLEWQDLTRALLINIKNNKIKNKNKRKRKEWKKKNF